MNKLIIVNNEIINKELDKNIKVTLQNESIISNIKIEIYDDADLTIEYTSNNETKLNINVVMAENIKGNLFEIKSGKNYKLGYNFDLGKNSILNVYKINDVHDIKENLVFNLNGESSKLNYLLKTISNSNEHYDLTVYHNSSNTQSYITNNGVNILDGEVSFIVSGFVPNGNVDCILDQKNRIINLTNNPCMIKPNLFIDENDVIANHSAHIGRCNADEIFYLMSRGIALKEAENLIIKGFLLNGLKYGQTHIENIINKYWR